MNDVVSFSNSNKRLIVPKRKSYRNHNIRPLLASQVTRSVRKRRYFSHSHLDLFNASKFIHIFYFFFFNFFHFFLQCMSMCHRLPAKLLDKQEDIGNNSTSVVNDSTYDISEALVNVDNRLVVNYPYNCINCGRKYQTISTLKRHMRSECNQPKKFICRLCNRGFHHNFKLSDHLRRLHNIK